MVLCEPAKATILASPPDEQVRLLEEHAFVVFDPLTATQTLVMHHVFAPTSVSFGLVIPVPANVTTKILKKRTRQALRRLLHPVGRSKRVFDVGFKSLLKGCVAREVGISDVQSQNESRVASLTNQPLKNLGPGVEALHLWLTRNGLTLAPKQIIRIEKLRNDGWSFVGVRINAGESDRHREQLKGPIIALSHITDNPLLVPIWHAAPALTPHVFELSVLTEWSVGLRSHIDFAPFYSMPMSESELKLLTRKVSKAPWTFRRSGIMTAFRNPPMPADGIIRLDRVEPRPKIKPPLKTSERPSSVVLPIELVAAIPLFFIWLMIRKRRKDRLFGRLGERLR